VLDHSEGDGYCRSLVALPQVGRGCAGFGDRRNLTKGGAWPAAWCISCRRCPRGEELWRGVVVVEHGRGEGRPGAGAGLRCKKAPWEVDLTGRRKGSGAAEVLGVLGCQG